MTVCKTRTVTGPAAALLAAMLIVTGCQSRPDSVTLGVALPQADHDSVRIAVDEINAGGGIDGVPLKLMGMNWEVTFEFSPDDIMLWMDRFNDREDLFGVIGYSDSSSALTSAPLYNSYRIPQIVTIASHTAITAMGEWTYRLCTTSTHMAVKMAEYAVGDWNKKRIAVFYVNDDYGKQLAQIFEERVEESGSRIVASHFHRNRLEEWDRKNIASVIDRLRTEEAPDLFVLFQRRLAASETIALIRSAGMEADILGGENVGYSEFPPRLADMYDGVRVAMYYLSSENNRAGMEFERKYREITGMNAKYSAAYGYDAVYLFRDAVLHGGFSRDGVKRHLDRLIAEKKVIEGVTGDYILGPGRDALRPFYIAEIDGGVYRHVKTIPAPAAVTAPAF